MEKYHQFYHLFNLFCLSIFLYEEKKILIHNLLISFKLSVNAKLFQTNKETTTTKCVLPPSKKRNIFFEKKVWIENIV